MDVEWLLRYDPERAQIARRADRWAFAVSMGAVFAHGYLIADTWVIGAVGAAVSALAKGGWSMAMRVHARPLDARTQQWVTARRAKTAPMDTANAHRSARRAIWARSGS
jgi:hypothetical protein